MRILTVVVAFVLAAAVAVPAFAQATGTSSSTQKSSLSVRPSGPKPKIAIRAFGVFDVETMTASQSFDAVTGSSTLIGYGGGADVVNLPGHLFVRGAFMTAPASGERAFVLDGSVFSTGVAIDVGVRTIELGGGFRMPVGKSRKVAPYVGGGLLLVTYTETSATATALEDVNESFTGYAVQGGLDFALSKWVYAGVEGQYRIVPNALGDGGVSKLYGETDLGGFAIRVMVGVNLKR